MTKEQVMEVVTHVDDCYRIKLRHVAAPFNFYVSHIGDWCLVQSGSGLNYKVVSFDSIEWVQH